MTGEQFEARDRQPPAQREAELFARLPDAIAHAMAAAPGWARHLAGTEPRAVCDRAALAALPVLRKSDLLALQRQSPPFGGFLAGDLKGAPRVYMSPGPIFEPQPDGEDPWNAARALAAAGFKPGDMVFNTFSYHMTPGGFLLDHGARALGCTVFPAGVGNTEMLVEAAAILQPDGYVGTPDFLKVILDKARDAGRDLGSIRRALVSGGALFPSLRAEYASRGVAVRQCYATAELGVIAYESEAADGMIVNEDCIVEIVRPGTRTPVADGEVGELVVTTFKRAYPMIRFGTGDLSAILPGRSACGRTNMRLAGWLGRADQRTKIKGMFVDPVQIADVLARHPELVKARLSVSRRDEQDVMALFAESMAQDAALAARVAETLRDVTKLKGAVTLVPPGSLPNDGKVIVDERDYSAAPA
ncbi:phenylacetate--CoA ligase family protein [Pannonibacter tanglangensis]|uniref:AMP-binding protein n=1 Tax=Pannonibacter tanglangensis TaxID=2750084 RepID=A0ABW9ZK85_9HYPH|nr:AMP-binding protein [Pannonibacter sp. XCT-34]NBN65322.1 AMP-binding protein [Pannonibacter sp. XCT-34]